jgi:regulator of nonsense transcripts 1
VTIPFIEEACYRLDDLEIGDLAVKRVMGALRLLMTDPDPQIQRSKPHDYICELLCLPPEEPYIARIVIQSKLARIEDDLELNVDTMDPIRVKATKSEAIREWNSAHPSKAIRIGDRIAKVVNGRGDVAESKEQILEEIQHARSWSRYELEITFMKKVKANDRNIQNDLLPNAEANERIFEREKPTLSEKLNSSQLEALRAASTNRVSLIQGPPGTGKTTTSVEFLAFLLDHTDVPKPILVSGHTNAAVDNLLVGLAKKGKRVVRLPMKPRCAKNARRTC